MFMSPKLLFDEISTHARSFEAGFEREWLLGAVEKETGKLFNCNLAEYVLSDQGFFWQKQRTQQLWREGWRLAEEYSKCLIEIVSPPFEEENSISALDELNEADSAIRELFPVFVEKRFPKLNERFNVFAWQPGASPTNQYIDENECKLSDPEDTSKIILPKYRRYLEFDSKVKIREGDWVEQGIGIYNHINSFNITVHPTYSGETEKDKRTFIRFLRYCTEVFDEFKKEDNGTKHVIRAGQKYYTEKNVRDVFLESAFPHFNHPWTSLELKLEGNNEEEWTAELSKNVNQLKDSKRIDESLRRWYVLNVRPRVIAGILCVEFKGYGANFPISAAKKLVEQLYEWDKNEQIA